MASGNRSKPRSFGDLTGRRFGKWTVNGLNRRTTSTFWNCTCDCGNKSVVTAANLVNGTSTNCGCTRVTRMKLSRTKEYNTWHGILQRCLRPRGKVARFYTGVCVCQRWRESFSAFLEDMGNAPSSAHSIDRIDGTGHYSCGQCDECRDKGWPANCRWATIAVQSRNRKSNRYYTHDGKTLVITDWEKLYGLPAGSLRNRLNRGLSIGDALSIGRYDRKAITRAKRHQT